MTYKVEKTADGQVCWNEELMPVLAVTGVVFVHDLSNARSYDHLKIWLRCVHIITVVYGLQLQCKLMAPLRSRSAVS